MKICAIFSGGKDSTYAAYIAMKYHELKCLVNVTPTKNESWLFHVPNTKLTEKQAEAIGLPIIRVETKGEKEKELEDLKKALMIAKERYGIEGVVTGAVKSTYQSSRFQRVCDELGLWCFNPLWLSDEIKLLENFINSGFKAVVVGVFSYPFDESWLGKKIDEKFVEEIKAVKEKFGVSAIGEGGEFETFVYDGPIFKKRIEILEFEKEYSNYSGVLKIKNVRLVEK